MVAVFGEREPPPRFEFRDDDRVELVHQQVGLNDDIDALVERSNGAGAICQLPPSASDVPDSLS